jgi:hypothetical protein
MTSSERFFDAVDDPAFMSAGRDGTSWTFVTFAGHARSVDLGSDPPRVGESWSLTSEAERAQGWRPGGLQLVDLHAASDRLFVVMHQGEAGSHKEAGKEIWVFDTGTQERVARLTVPNLTAAFLVDQMDVETGGWIEGLLHWALPDEGAHSIAVSQDDHPVLFVRSGMMGAVAVLDADSGETLRFLTETGLTGPTLRVP